MRTRFVWMLAAGLLAAVQPAQSAQITIDVTNIASWDGFDDPDNIRDNYDIGANSLVTGIGWNVTLEGLSTVGVLGGSWLSEIKVNFSGVDGQVTLTPGTGDGFTGGPNAYSSSGIVDLVGYGVPYFHVGADGLLAAQFFESFDDAVNVIDGYWRSGTITIEYTPGIAVPEPGSVVLLGLGLVGLGLSRRRNAN